MGYKYVEIEKDGETGLVLPQSVKTWEKYGWTAVEDGDEEKVVESSNPAAPEPLTETQTETVDTEGEDQ